MSNIFREPPTIVNAPPRTPAETRFASASEATLVPTVDLHEHLAGSEPKRLNLACEGALCHDMP